METKKCSKCSKVKPVDKFRKQKGGKYGVGGICLECFNASRRVSNAERIDVKKTTKFGESQVRVFDHNGEMLFLARDITNSLEYSEDSSATRKLSGSEKKVIIVNLDGKNGSKLFVNESGMYKLILGSKKPKAKEFKDWITNEVLPTIRKTGEYKTDTSVDDRLEAVGIKFKEPEVKGKVCSKCGMTKSLDEFHMTGYNKKGEAKYRGECKECFNERRRKKSEPVKNEDCTQNDKTVHVQLEKTVYDTDPTPIEPTINETLDQQETTNTQQEKEPIKEPELESEPIHSTDDNATKAKKAMEGIFGKQHSNAELNALILLGTLRRISDEPIKDATELKKAKRKVDKELHPDKLMHSGISGLALTILEKQYESFKEAHKTLVELDVDLDNLF